MTAPTTAPMPPMPPTPARPKKPWYKNWKVWGIIVAALLVIGMIDSALGGGKKADTPATTAPATQAAAPASKAPKSKAPETKKAETPSDTAASIMERIDCDKKVMSKDKLDADALTPRWAASAKTVAGCTYKDWTQIVVAEFASNDDALKAVAVAQEAEGWKARVTVDGRFARGASGKDWSAVKFPKAQQ